MSFSFSLILERKSYHAYWKSVVLNYLVKNPNQKTCSIHLIAETTGMAPHDIAETLHRLGMIERDPETEKWKILRRPDLLNAFKERQKACTR